LGDWEAGGKTKITFRYRSLLNGFWVVFATFLGLGDGVDCDVWYSNIDRQYFCATRKSVAYFFWGLPLSARVRMMHVVKLQSALEEHEINLMHAAWLSVFNAIFIGNCFAGWLFISSSVACILYSAPPFGGLRAPTFSDP